MPQRLAQHLIARGLLPARVVDEALRRLGREGGTLDSVLLEMGAVSEAGMLQAISDVSGVRLVNLADFEPNAEAGPLMPFKMARQLNVVPLSVDGQSLHLACAYPLQQPQLKDVGFLLGRKLELWVALECRVRDWQQTLYGQKAEPRYQRLLSQLDPSRPKPKLELKPEPEKFEGETESLSTDVLERLAKGIVEEPVLLDRPKKKDPKEVKRPKIEVLDEPAPKSVEVMALGDEEEAPRTSVLDPLAYSRFARAEHGHGEENSPGVDLEDDHHSTRVMDISGYKNFAKEISNTPSGEFVEPRPSAPVPPPPRISFPGGVLPPRRSSSDAVPVRKQQEPVEYVQPASAPRPSSEKVRPAERKAVAAAPPKPVRSPPEAPPRPVRSQPRISSPPIDEMDFSDVNEVVSSPGERPFVPPEPPTPPDFTKQEYSPAPQPLITQAPVQLLNRVEEEAPAPEPIPEPVPEPAQEAWVEPPAQPAELVTQPPTAAVDYSRVQGILPSPPGLVASSATEWSLAQARVALREAVNDREHLMHVVLEYARRTFEFIGSFAVMRGAAVGWDARGDGDVSAIRQLAIPLDAASVFRTVALTRGSYVGPLPPDALSQHYLALLGRMPRTVFVWPVEVQSRLVAMLYGDCGARPISQRRLADFILFCQDLPSAFHELILFRKQNPRVPQQFASHSGIIPDPGYAEDGAAAHAPADEDWFQGLITLLTGPDPSERSMAMMELMKHPEVSAQALATSFPGPTGWSRLPVVELPEPDELGPIPGALARLGQAGASAVAPLLDHEDSDTRYLALLTAGSLRYPDVVDGVLRGLFDYEPDISSAARAAAAALRLLDRKSVV